MKPNLLLFSAAILLFQTTSATAQTYHGNPPGSVKALDEENINQFLKEVSEISSGQRAGMADEDVAAYFTGHIAEQAHFKSEIRYEIPGYPVRDTALNLSRQDYIASVTASRFAMEDYTASIEIRDLKIGMRGQNATFTSIITEKGKMAFPKDPAKPEETEITPIEGLSTCAQELSLSPVGLIRMEGADCETTIRFDPFGGAPLIPE